jgi:NitT/TauT family transport system permease protein
MMISDEHRQYLKKIKSNGRKVVFTQVSILVLFFALWEVLGQYKIIDPFLI